jgi:hypothetical protein
MDTTAQPTKRSPRQWPIAAAAVVFGVVLFVASPGASGDSTDDHSDMAVVMCEDFVRDSLRAPSTADFASASDATVDQLQPGTYSVTSHVDAQNGFGAMIRTRYACTVRYDGEAWYLKALAAHE